MPRTSTGRIIPGARKLTDKQLWELRASKLSTSAAVERYGITHTSVQRIRKGQYLQHVPNPMADQLTVEQLMYLLSQHPPQDLIDMESLCIEIRQGFYQDNEPEET